MVRKTRLTSYPCVLAAQLARPLIAEPGSRHIKDDSANKIPKTSQKTNGAGKHTQYKKSEYGDTVATHCTYRQTSQLYPLQLMSGRLICVYPLKVDGTPRVFKTLEQHIPQAGLARKRTVVRIEVRTNVMIMLPLLDQKIA